MNKIVYDDTKYEDSIQYFKFVFNEKLNCKVEQEQD